MSIPEHDLDVIRELAARVAEIAALPVQEEKRDLWRRLNGLDCANGRPMVMIDQVCWNEMNIDDELTLRCEDAECRQYEQELRRTLFQWNHFPVDRVVEPFIRVAKAVGNTGFGIAIHEETAITDPQNDVIGHHYDNQFADDADLDKIRMPLVTHDEAETERRLAVAHELFDGLLEVQPTGPGLYLSLWDPISMWMSVQDALLAMVDRPAFIHAMLERMTVGYLSMLDQLEELRCLPAPDVVIHCTGAYTDELPAPGYDPDRPRTQDRWMFGLAQMLGSVSPAMYQEFEVAYTARIAERFGLVYYGCCEPLDTKMDQVRAVPNVRKVSMSPWVDVRRGAEEIAGQFVFSRKPNPAFLAKEAFDADEVRTDLEATKAACEANGCPLEFILKDLSTVRHDPQRLFDWARIAMEIAEG